jgi:orotate phosphoribosyltransferase
MRTHCGGFALDLATWDRHKIKSKSPSIPLLQRGKTSESDTAARPYSVNPAWQNRGMDDYSRRFLDLAGRAQALRFGEFTLKSGRVSPYFFNAGRFDSGDALAGLARCYADAVDAAGVAFDLLFGPAYKGIPLATALACEYARRGRDLPLAFNRKEAKAHGEGGSLIGAPLDGRRVLIVDDVITAGTAIREALAIIGDAGGTAAGIVIALDRQEVVGDGDAPGQRRSAAQAVASEHGIPVIAVATLADLLAFAGESATLAAERDRLHAYRARYGSHRST